MVQLGIRAVVLPMAVLVVVAADCLPNDFDEHRKTLALAIDKAQRRFDGIESSAGREAVEAMRLVIKRKRSLLDYLVTNKQDVAVDAIRSEVRSLARSIAWLAGKYEQELAFKLGQAEWADLAKCCKQALGADCPEHWDAIHEAESLGRMAQATPDKIQEYLAIRGKIRQAVAQKDLAAAESQARDAYEKSCDLFGELVPRTIASLDYAAKVAFTRQRYEQAFAWFEDAVSKRQGLYPAWHPALDKSILSLGSRYESRGRFVDAEKTFRRAKPTLQRWSCLIRLAMRYRKAGQPHDAMRLFEDVFVSCSETIGDNHPLRAMAGTQLGEICRSLGRYQQALERLSVCSQIWRANENNFELANCLNSIALVHQQSGDHATAESKYREAVELLVFQDQGRGLELRTATEANYASLLEETGRFPEALKLYETIVQAKNAKAQLSSVDLNARENLARLYQSVGELAKAETLLDALLQYEGRAPSEVARLHSLRGRFFLQLGVLEKADTELDIALMHLEKNATTAASDLAAVWSLKALVLLERNELPAALEKYEKVLQSYIGSFGQTHVRCAEIYDQIAKVHRRLGSYHAAIDAHSKAIGIYESAYGKSHEAVAWASHRLGTTHFVYDKPDLACQAWRRSFEIKQNICQEVLPWLPEAQASAFLTSLTTNDSSAGRDTLLSILSRDRAKNAAEAFQCVWRSRGLVLNAIANRERRLAVLKSDPERAKLSKIRGRLAQLSIYAGSEEGPQRESRLEILRNLSEEKEELERAIAERAITANGGNVSDSLLSDVVPDELMEHLSTNTALVQIVRTERWKGTARDSSDITKETVYDAFVVTRTSTTAATTGNASAVGFDFRWVELGDAVDIDLHIENWRKAIVSGGGGTRGKRIRKQTPTPVLDSVRPSREYLGEKVWQPISRCLGGRSQVVVIPDGKFHRMPWGALPGSKTDYLVEEVRITTAADGRQLARLYQSSQTNKRAISEANAVLGSGPFLLVGGVDYNVELTKPVGGKKSRKRQSTWPLLDGAKKEVAAIGSVLPTRHTHTLIGEEATEGNVKTELEKSTLVHIATHGYYADELDEDMTTVSSRGAQFGSRETTTSLASRNPLLQCGLTLAGCNSEIWLDAAGLPIDTGQDGYLSAEEIMGMDLTRTRLVVLSACETGLGSIGSGEGVFGLQRALHISGVKSTIASGWKVDDRGTQLLMTVFYEKMFGERLAPADALHAAQLIVLRQFDSETGQLNDGKNQLSSPYYWAAFTFSGVTN